MATLFITAYQGLASDQRGNTVQAGLEPAVAHFTAGFTSLTSTPVQLLPFSGGGTNSYYYRLTATIAYHCKFGTASTVTATVTNARSPADVIEFVGSDRPGLWVSVIGAV